MDREWSRGRGGAGHATGSGWKVAAAARSSRRSGERLQGVGAPARRSSRARRRARRRRAAPSRRRRERRARVRRDPARAAAAAPSSPSATAATARPWWSSTCSIASCWSSRSPAEHHVAVGPSSAAEQQLGDDLVGAAEVEQLDVGEVEQGGRGSRTRRWPPRCGPRTAAPVGRVTRSGRAWRPSRAAGGRCGWSGSSAPRVLGGDDDLHLGSGEEREMLGQRDVVVPRRHDREPRRAAPDRDLALPPVQDSA